MDRRGGVIDDLQAGGAAGADCCVVCRVRNARPRWPSRAGTSSAASSWTLAGADAVLYEVTEKMYLLDAAGNDVAPEQAVARKADASLVGWARLGTPLCPYEQMVTNLRR